MPTLSRENVLKLEALMKEYRIDFAGEIHQSEWPTCHTSTLNPIKVLGDKRFDTYATDPNITEDEPWKLEVKREARKLVEAAKSCKRRNESCWRFACEPIVFARLSAEVACYNCRKRVWRSEIEVERDDGSRRAATLTHRQRMREPCRCSRTARSKDSLEAVGLNKIFGHREDEFIHHDPEVTEKLPKREKPDAVFGLRETRNLENLLNDTAKQSLNTGDGTLPRQVHELLLHGRPLDQTGECLLFPFLVFEAKSGSSGDDWYSIKIQSAFTLRTFLQSQNSLKSATAELSRWESGPLVWFFSNRGGDWMLSVAYMQSMTPTRHSRGNIVYRVVDMWRGSIVTLDGALQLLLLVDYICEWARDKYREDILVELRVLASGENDAASIPNADTEVYSTCHMEPFGDAIQGDQMPSHQTCISARETIAELDSPDFVYRHATFIESRYCCIFITRDNVRTLIQSTSPAKRERMCRLLLDQASKSMQLDQEALHKMEESWTGDSRTPPSRLRSTRFYTTASATTYLDEDWNQVRECYVIAIDEDAWEAVVDASNLKRNRLKTRKPQEAAQSHEHAILRAVERFKSGSLDYVLLAAIIRRAVTFQPCAAGRIRSVRSDGTLRDIVQYVYRSFKKGSFEPREPFLIVSKKCEAQHLLKLGTSQPPLGETLQTSCLGLVLITTRSHSREFQRSRPAICIYSTDVVGNAIGRPTKEYLINAVVHTFGSRDVYHTTTDNGTSNVISPGRKGRGAVPWNLKGTYGIYSSGVEFLVIHRRLSLIPRAQGSLRCHGDPPELCFHTRNLLPWTDPRRPEDVMSRAFIAYKLITSEISSWRALAQKRSTERIRCCPYCAATGTDNVCRACKAVLRDPLKPEWFKRCMLGRSSFEQGEIKEEEPDDEVGCILDNNSNSLDIWTSSLASYPWLDLHFAGLWQLHAQLENYVNWMQIRQNSTSISR